ncbi:MAG: hypothetical protein LBV20_07715 [Treponema sp.]|nr:hypothetical protein [Treponema sp.]
MKSFLKVGFFVLVLFLLLANNVAAQEKKSQNNDVLSFYGTELFQWSYDAWGGLSLNYQNQSSTPDGLKDSMEKALASYEETNQKMLSFKQNNIFGNIFLGIGLTAAISGPFVAIYGPHEGGVMTPVTMYTTLGLSGGGLLLTIVGVLIYDQGIEDIFDAVNLYNRMKISEYHGR